VKLGEFGRDTSSLYEITWVVLQGEFLLAIILGGISVTALAWNIRKSKIQAVFIIFLLAGWILIAFVFPPALQYEDIAIGISYWGIWALFLGTFTLVVIALIQSVGRGKRIPGNLAIVFFGSLVLYLLPFVLWFKNILPDYYLAEILGVLLSGGFVVWRFLDFNPQVALKNEEGSIDVNNA
jgi:hypothetical protein